MFTGFRSHPGRCSSSRTYGSLWMIVQMFFQKLVFCSQPGSYVNNDQWSRQIMNRLMQRPFSTQDQWQHFFLCVCLYVCLSAQIQSVTCALITTPRRRAARARCSPPSHGSLFSFGEVEPDRQRSACAESGRNSERLLLFRKRPYAWPSTACVGIIIMLGCPGPGGAGK